MRIRRFGGSASLEPPYIFYDILTSIIRIKNMSKGQDSKKTTKKEPTKTMKEKRALKKLKKDEKNRG